MSAVLKRGRTKWFALAALLVAGGAFLAITVSGIGENLVYYWGPKELRAAGNKAVGATVRLGGQVAPGSVKPCDGVSNLEFDVTDGTALVHVVSKGVPPQLFRDRIGVVVEGTMTTAGVSESRRLMVSHDNKYRRRRTRTWISRRSCKPRRAWSRHRPRKWRKPPPPVEQPSQERKWYPPSAAP
jgi:cytochrome c-type biogenesis protein CcmE